ncbi:MAG: FAD-dependent oxidoreductase [Chloroflexota bacterium]|nr:FAD-dependent oxidoreductase [Chloroflexota bacterium]
MKTTKDVIVIGGGVMGTSIAYQLASRGMDVILLEKSFLGAGSSGRSSAIIRQHYSNETTARMARHSLEVFQNFGEIIGGNVDFEKTGMLFITPADDQAGMESNVLMQRRVGIDTRVLSGAELKELQPQIAGWQDVVAAWEPEAGHCDPAGTVNAFAAAAKRKGASIRQGVEVLGINMAGGRVQGVTTSGGEITAPVVVNAAGPWARPVAQNVGVDIPAYACRVQVSLLGWPEGFQPHPIVADFVNVIYFRPETGRQTLIGSIDPAEANDRVNPDRFNEGVDFGFVLDSAERAVQRYPALEAAESRGGFASLYTITPDWHPILDEVPAGSGCFLACGFSGHGFKLAPAIGEMAADLVTGEARSGFDLELFRLDRFATSKPVRGQYEYSIIG